MGARLVLLGLCAHAAGWISIAQSSRGVTLDEYRQAEIYNSNTPPDRTLGTIWSDGRTRQDHHGLGQSITWAWDPALCDELMDVFRTRAFGISIGIDCQSLRAAMHRAFSTWSQNHPAINFLEVTDLCEQAGTLTADCPHAEVWVTWRNASNTPNYNSAGEMMAAAIFAPSITSDFRLTNGHDHHRDVRLPSGALFEQTKQTYEIARGRVEFNANGDSGVCWYLDSAFCAVFHGWKRQFSSPETPQYVLMIVLIALSALAAIDMVVEVVLAMRAQLKMRARVFIDRNGDGKVEAHEVAVQAIENAYLRLQAFLAAIAAESILGTALRLTLLIVPWPMYFAVFAVCWDCHDFEAAAAHEIGHLLGLGHPDKQPGAEIIAGYAPLSEGTYYHSLFAAGAAALAVGRSSQPINASHCETPWQYVAPGVPADFPAGELRHTAHDTLVRPSIMESFTTHNPSVCLFQDDYEALLTLYPVCGFVPPVPKCEKADRNIGALRVLAYIFLPLLVTLVASILLHIFVEREQKRIALKKEAVRLAGAEGTLTLYTDKYGEQKFAIGSQHKRVDVEGKYVPADSPHAPPASNGAAGSSSLEGPNAE